MELCFFVAGKPDCSLFDRTSLTWVIKPGRSKILRLGDDAVQYIENPLRFPEVDRWKAVSCDDKTFVVNMYFILELKKGQFTQQKTHNLFRVDENSLEQ